MSSNVTTLRTASVVAARFGRSYGYRFDGDNVTLHASVQLVHFLEQEVQWLLQLQAKPTDETASKTSFTHVIAEVALPPLAELTGSGDVYSITTLAIPPAGQGEFNLSLALISRQADQIDEAHDSVCFSRPERFVQPRLVGPLTCNFTQNEVSLAIERIENPRDPANVSGTLSLELWALTKPYAGGAFTGQPLAGTVLGCLSGQEGWSNAVYSLHYARPTVGSWQVTVMLREWTGASYATRDFLNLSEPLQVSPEKVASAQPKNTKPQSTSKLAPVAAVVPATPVVKTPAKTKTAKAAGKSRPAKSAKK